MDPKDNERKNSSSKSSSYHSSSSRSADSYKDIKRSSSFSKYDRKNRKDSSLHSSSRSSSKSSRSSSKDKNVRKSSSDSSSLAAITKPTSSSSKSEESPKAPFPTLAPFQPPSSSSPYVPATWRCSLCSVTVQSELAFHQHLTLKHYKERIERRIKSPFKCLTCDYVSPGHMTDTEKTSDLLLHYGLKERVSIKFYNQECANMTHTQEKEKKSSDTNLSSPSSLRCNICNISVDSRIFLLKHLTLKHFAKTLYDELPKEKPFKCPYKDCNETKSDSHRLLLHYGINHKKVMHFYRKHKNNLSNVDKSRSKPSSSKDSAPKVELPETPRLNKLKAVVSPYNPLSDKQKTCDLAASSTGSRQGSRDAMSPSSSDASSISSPPPVSGSPRTISPETGLAGDSSESASVRLRIEYLERRLKAQEFQQKEKLKEKQTEFERWLAAKEKALQEEKAKSKILEEKLEEKEGSISDLQTQLEMVHESMSKVEDDMAEKNKMYDDLLNIKQENERQMEEKEAERINSYEELYQKEKELESVLESLEGVKKELSESKKENESLETKFTELENQHKSLERNSEEVQNKFSDNQELLEEIQGKNEEMHTEILLLKSERKNLNKTLADLTAANDKEVNDLKDKLNSKEKESVDKNALKAAEKEKKELLKKIKKFENTLSEWETRQFTNVKLISGLEKERDSLQQKLKEMKDGNLSHEDELYWKDVAIKNANKETKALQAQYDSLNKELEESNKKVSKLEQQAKNNSKICEELEKLKEKVSDMVSEEKYNNVMKTLDLRDGEIKHLKITLDTKIKNYANLNSSHQEMKDELKKLKAEKTKLDKKLSTQTSKLEELSTLCSKQKSEVEEVRSQSDLDQVKIHQLQAQLHQYQEIQNKNKKAEVAGTQRRRQQNKGKMNQENRIEMLMMNQVLKDMDTVIKLRDQGVSPEQEFASTLVQDESLEGTSYTESINSLLTVQTEDDQVQFTNSSDHSYPLSSPPIVSPELNRRARKRKSATPKKINKKFMQESKDIKSEDDIIDMLDEDIQDILKSPDLNTNSPSIESKPRGNKGKSKFQKKTSKGKNSKVEESKIEETVVRAPSKTRTRNQDAKNSPSVEVKSEEARAQPEETRNHPEESRTQRGKRAAARMSQPLDPGSIETSSKRPKYENSNDSKKKTNKKAQSTSGLVDVTHEYSAEEEGGDYVCGVCGSWDVPEHLVTGGETTEWIGCDCDRWFHKQCTGLKKFTTKFSCKSLKMDCLIIPITMDSVSW